LNNSNTDSTAPNSPANTTGKQPEIRLEANRFGGCPDYTNSGQGKGVRSYNATLIGVYCGRPLRIEYPGAVYYITTRGNAYQKIFVDNTDRESFLEILGETAARFNSFCHAYCLMTNHYHLETVDPTLSRGMRQLNGVYTQASNRRHHQVGHLFQGGYGDPWGV